MEFFEKAHIGKQSGKSIRSDDKVKKQLKQMLYGYKNSDNEVIRSATENKKEFEDSSSVSGFSDLNITNSSNDDLEKQSPEKEDDNVSGVSEFELSDESEIEEVLDEGSEYIEESIPDYRNDFKYASSEDSEIDFRSDIEDDMSDINNLVGSSELQTVDDDDSNMAFKHRANQVILTETSKESKKSGEKRSKAKLVKPKKKKNSEMHVERKQYNIPVEGTDTDSCDYNNIKKRTKDKVHKKKKQPEKQKTKSSSSLSIFKNCKNTKQVLEMQVDSYSGSQSTEDDISKNIMDYTENDSPSFISLDASNLPTSDDNILNEYKFPTMKNLPSEVGLCESNDIFKVSPNSLTDAVIQDALNDNLMHKTYLSNDDDNLKTSELSEPEESMSQSCSQNAQHSLENSSYLSSEEQMNIDQANKLLALSVKEYKAGKSYVIVLKHPTQLYIHGKVKIASLGGTMEVLGYKIKESPTVVYAPYNNAAQCIKTVECNNSYHAINSKLVNAGLSTKEAKELVTNLGPHDGVLHIQKAENPQIDFVENNFINNLFLNKYRKKCDDYILEAVSDYLQCTLYLSKPLRCIEENYNWEQAIEYGIQSRQSKGIIIGGKGVGKSAFLRYYVNRILSKSPVLVIDLDPGQCEFTVAGNISATVVREPLVGPNFTHLKTPEKILNLGMINTMDNRKLYANAVQSLITYCSQNQAFQNIPWIVNTMGMCNNIGLKLITLIILQLRPTFVVQLDSKFYKKRFESRLDAGSLQKLYTSFKRDSLFRNLFFFRSLDYNFCLIDSYEKSMNPNNPLKPRDERYLNFLAYFGQLSAGESILSITPYEVRLEDVYVAINVKIEGDMILQMINGKIIALCEHTPTEDKTRIFTMADKPLPCFGHGLIRGVDVEKGLLYVITPVPPSKLSVVNALVYADWAPELTGQEKDLPTGTAVPYRMGSTSGEQNELLSSPKRRFNPLQLIKLSKNK